MLLLHITTLVPVVLGWRAVSQQCNIGDSLLAVSFVGPKE